jgi:hypothetical protein
MIVLFWIFFIATGFFVRILTHLTHNNRKYPYTRNLTGYLRKLTKKDIHHIHLGFLLFLITLLLIFIFGANSFNIILSAISLSLIADQIIPYLNSSVKYFEKKGILSSILAHIILGLIVTGIMYLLA